MIVAGGLLLAGLSCIAVGHTMGGHAYLSDGDSRLVATTLTPEGDFDSISLETLSADVTLLYAEDGICRVEARDQEGVEYTAKVEDGVLTVRGEDTRQWYDRIGIMSSGEPTLTVYLPAQSYKSLSASVTTGNVTVGRDFTFSGSVVISVTTGDVSLSASVERSTTLSATTGDIRVEGTHKVLSASVTTGRVTVQSSAVESLSIKSGSGSVTIQDLTAEGAVRVEITTGSQSLLRVTCGELDLHAGTGDVTLTDTVAAGHLQAKTTTGDVTFVRSDAATLFVKTNTGDVAGSLLTPKIFAPDTTSGSIDVPKSTEGGLCEIKTTSGSICITLEE